MEKVILGFIYKGIFSKKKNELKFLFFIEYKMNHLVHKIKWKRMYPAVPYHVISLDAPWRKMGYITDRLREMQIDIRKAYIQKDSSILYLKGNKGRPLVETQRKYIEQVMEEGYFDSYSNTSNAIKLPANTEIHLYNIPGLAYTTLEFSCEDRIGLLSDVMEMMSSFPYDLNRGYISTIGPYAHNVFFLENNQKPLRENEILYISNVFEYEIKEAMVQSELKETSI